MNGLAAADSPAAVRPGTPGRTLIVCAVALGALTLLVYSNSFTAGLTLDNRIILGGDVRIREWNWQNLELIFTRDYWFPSASGDLYRPLTTLSYLFNYAVLGNGVRPFGYHWVNFLLHWANVVLVLVILHRLTGRLRLAVVAAAIFAVHPVNVESVTNIVGRADLLAALFVLLGGWCHRRAAAVAGWRQVPWRIGLLMAAILAVLAKENGVMICAVVLLYDWLWAPPAAPGTARRDGIGAAVRRCWPGWLALAPAVLLLLAVRHQLALNAPVHTHLFVDNPIVDAGLVQGRLTAIGVIGRYLGLLVLPIRLSCDYSYNQIPLYGTAASRWHEMEAWLSLAVIGGLLATAVRWRRAQPAYTWGVLFFFVMLLPTSNLILPIGSIMAERFLYLPSIGLALVAALALEWPAAALARRMPADLRWSHLALGLAGLAIAALGLRAHARNADWQDERALWRSAVAAAPDSFKTHKGYAQALWETGGDEAAIDAAIARAGVALAVLDRPPLPERRRDNVLFTDLGRYYRIKGEFVEQRGDLGGAQRFYERAVDTLLRAREVDRWANQASRLASLARGQAADQIPDVGNPRVYNELGRAWLRLGNWAEAAEAGRVAIRLAPERAAGYLISGDAALGAGHADEAAIRFISALLVDPKNDEAWDVLAQCYQTMGEEPIPISGAGAARSLDDRNPVVRRQLDQACVALVRQLLEVRRDHDAQQFRDKAIRNYGVPATAFDATP